LLRITLFQAFLNTNIAILNRLCEVDGSIAISAPARTAQ
jgi:hypothetical protein